MIGTNRKVVSYAVGRLSGAQGASLPGKRNVLRAGPVERDIDALALAGPDATWVELGVFRGAFSEFSQMCILNTVLKRLSVLVSIPAKVL